MNGRGEPRPRWTTEQRERLSATRKAYWAGLTTAQRATRADHQGALEAEDVRIIRLSRGKIHQAELARIYRVSKTTISDIQNRKTRGWIED